MARPIGRQSITYVVVTYLRQFFIGRRRGRGADLRAYLPRYRVGYQITARLLKKMPQVIGQVRVSFI